jgi:hypothetical protein
MRGVRAGCLLAVSDAIGSNKVERIGDSALREAVNGMVGLALEALKALN